MNHTKSTSPTVAVLKINTPRSKGIKRIKTSGMIYVK